MSKIISQEQRSKIMASIHRENTRPELLIRKLAHKMGYRFRLHKKNLPGSPDIVFPGLKKIILVHGCFWHRHECPSGRKIPSKNTTYWQRKFANNVARDQRILKELHNHGWKVFIIWECEILASSHELISKLIEEFLGPRFHV